jgi:hypothetical protein
MSGQQNFGLSAIFETPHFGATFENAPKPSALRISAFTELPEFDPAMKVFMLSETTNEPHWKFWNHSKVHQSEISCCGGTKLWRHNRTISGLI